MPDEKPVMTPEQMEKWDGEDPDPDRLDDLEDWLEEEAKKPAA